MNLLLLGTGASDGVPNCWCNCPTCAEARTTGALRTNASALVDGRLLIDPGPEAPRQAQRAGLDLAGVTTVLITHAHDDHLNPTFLMHRSWVTDAPLRVIGPAPAIARCVAWLPDGHPAVTLSTVTAGDEFEVDSYHVRVIPATHQASGEAVLYSIERGGRRLLYATDTGPWRPDALAALRGPRLDLVLLELTFGDGEPATPVHHNLASFAAAVADLRQTGAIGPDTRLVATHIGHDNPLLAELTDRLARIGAEVYPDLTTLAV